MGSRPKLNGDDAYDRHPEGVRPVTSDLGEIAPAIHELVGRATELRRLLTPTAAAGDVAAGPS